MTEIKITIRAEEDDLRAMADHGHRAWAPSSPAARVSEAIAAALPKPRIQVKPGMVLRRRGSDVRWVGVQAGTRVHLFSCDGLGEERSGEVNPDFWEVILDVD